VSVDPTEQPPLPEPEPPREIEVTVTTEVRAVPVFDVITIRTIERTTETEPIAVVTPEVRPQPPVQYEPRLASVPPSRSRMRDKPSWVFWIWESRGVTYSYDILEWSVRVGFLALGLFLGWLVWHMH